MTTLASIQARIAKLQAQAETLVATKSLAALEKIRGLMERHGISIADIEAHVGKQRGRKPGPNSAGSRSASVAMYADPKSGATWSGRGRAPSWIAGAKDRSRFLVDGSKPDSVPAANKAVKAGNYRRGPHPALYRDPQSGATWSGRGRAPAWLAGVKDRTRFLIAEPAVARKAKVVKTVATRKTVAKKKVTATKKAAVKTVAARKTAPKNDASAPEAATRDANMAAAA